MPRNNPARLSHAGTPTAPDGAPAGNNMGLITPTEFVLLPSKGLLYPPDHPLHNKEDIEIKYMTAREEDILSSESLIKKGVVLDRLIQNIIIDKNIDPSSLLVADRSEILVATRASGYGEDYDFIMTCPECEAKNESSFNLDERTVTPFNSNNADVTLTERGTCIVKLPKTKAELEFRLLNGRDEKAFTRITKSKLQISTIITDQLKRLVVSVNGVETPTEVHAFIDVLPAYDSRYLRNLIADVAPDTKMSFDFACESCDHHSASVVPITLAFFWPDAGIY